MEGKIGGFGAIEWLKGIDPKLVPFMQMGSSAVFALASLVVALSAFRLSRVNSVGTKPIAFFTQIENVMGQDELTGELKVRLEVWNRRKYPIVLRTVIVAVDEEGLVMSEGDGWERIVENQVGRKEEIVVAGTEHCRLEVSGSGKEGFHQPECRGLINYFDPAMNKELRIQIRREYVRGSPLAYERFSWEWFQRALADLRHRLLRS